MMHAGVDVTDRIRTTLLVEDRKCDVFGGGPRNPGGFHRWRDAQCLMDAAEVAEAESIDAEPLGERNVLPLENLTR